MPSKNKQPQIPLPRSWDTHVKTAILHVVALARYALTYSRSWAADSTNQRIRLKAENDRFQQELALRQKELRIKDARIRQMAPARRPHYPPTERMAILELRAVRGWSSEQTARTFLVTADTIRAWLQRIDETGAKALVQTSLPVNRFPDYVRYLVQRLEVLCPTMGKQKIAQVLCRAGLHLGTTTVGRIRRWEAGRPMKSTSHSGRRIKVLGSSLVPSGRGLPGVPSSGAGQGTARSADRACGELPAQPQAFACRHHPARGVSGISSESLTAPILAHRLPCGLHPGRGAIAPVRRSCELACGTCFPRAAITRNATAESPWTSAPLQ